GIVFSRNTTQSVARDNYIHDQTIPIQVSKSHNNEVYNNTISNTNTTGISLIGDASGNKIYNNSIINAQSGLTIKNTATNNTIYSNMIINPIRKGIVVDENIANYNSIEDSNQIINDKTL